MYMSWSYVLSSISYFYLLFLIRINELSGKLVNSANCVDVEVLVVVVYLALHNVSGVKISRRLFLTDLKNPFLIILAGLVWFD